MFTVNRTQVAVCDRPWAVEAAGLHAAQCGTIGVVLPVAQSREGRTGAGPDAGAGGPLSALWLPAYRDLSRPRRSQDELCPRLSAVWERKDLTTATHGPRQGKV
jgi:hypothetical protein